MKKVVYNDLWAARSAGLLIPLFSVRTEKSLGIGDIGDLYPLVDWAAEHGQRIIQLLPLNDTAPGDPSPYAAVSAFAANPLYINIDAVDEVLLSEGGRLLRKEWDADGTIAALQESRRVDYKTVRAVKMGLLAEGFHLFLKESWEEGSERGDDFLTFVDNERGWLKDYAFFRVIKEREGEKDWRRWEEALRWRELHAMERFEKENSVRILFYQWLQWLFMKQWEGLRSYAHGKGVFLMGDVAFYPGVDSADVWTNSHLFQMNEELVLEATSGAPPDYFNPDGQDWGTPLYDWDRMEKDDFLWWVKRIERVCSFFDLYRLDHFRGFESYWRVPAGMKASEGDWGKGPGERLLQRLLKVSLYESLLIPLAEDLGDITEEVHILRKSLGIAGYKTFIFGWGEGEESGKASGYRYPEEYGSDFLATTGTHDTPTMREWWDGLREDEMSALSDYLSLPGGAGFDRLREAVLGRLFNSSALFLVLPIQDIFGLGADDRINLPGTFGEQNWTWRMPFTVEALASGKDERISRACDFLKRLTFDSGRAGIREGGEEETRILAMLPSEGTVQAIKRGENFIIWLALGGHPERIEATAEMPGRSRFDITFEHQFPGNVSLYRGTLATEVAGSYSLRIIADGEELVVDNCLVVH